MHCEAPDKVDANMAESQSGPFSQWRAQIVSQVDSFVPRLGSRLEVKWYYGIPLVAGICGAHLAL